MLLQSDNMDKSKLVYVTVIPNREPRAIQRLSAIGENDQGTKETSYKAHIHVNLSGKLGLYLSFFYQNIKCAFLNTNTCRQH